MRFVDNLVFENSGEGFQIYGSAPVLRNIYFEGNAAFCTGLVPYAPDLAKDPQMNVLIGGSKHSLTCVIVRNNCTYHPSPAAKRGVDIGYLGKPNSQILIENNYFTGGSQALELNGIAEAAVRHNTFWSPNGMVAVSFAPTNATDQAGLAPAHAKSAPARAARRLRRRSSSRTMRSLTTANSISPIFRGRFGPGKRTNWSPDTTVDRQPATYSSASIAMNRSAFIWSCTTGPGRQPWRWISATSSRPAKSSASSKCMISGVRRPWPERLPACRLPSS